MPRRHILRTSDPSEIGRIVRELRRELGLSLRDVRDLLGIDDSNLSKAERGVPAFEATARKAAQGLAAERERRRSETPDAVDERRFEFHVEIRIPSALHDVVARVREDDRRSRFELLREAFEARGVTIERSADDPEEALIGGVARVDLDSLAVFVLRTPDRPRLLRGGFQSVAEGAPPDPASFEREVSRVLTLIHKHTDEPMT